MATFADRLNMALADRRISAAELSRMIDVNEATISNYRKGKYEPKQKRTQAIANALGVNVSWLMGADCPMTGSDSAVNFRSIGNVAAGYGIVAEENFEDDFFSIPESILKGYSREDFMMLTVSGNSMYPYYQDGDHVLILRTPQCENGAIAVVYYGEEVNGTLKKVYFEGTAVRLKPLNPKYEEILIKGSDLDYFRIVGIPKFLARTM